jgi:pimeloyl-ACP methyl ester carboxylesterase
MPRALKHLAFDLLVLVGCLTSVPACMPPSWGAAALLHPARHMPQRQPLRPFEPFEWQGAGVKLVGWWFHAPPGARGTLIYLHGVSDNRASSVGIAEHFVPLGFDVVAYDSRAHGESGGEACTYGYYEKQDLARVIDHLPRVPVVVMGTSLGAGVALQAAAEDRRIAAVISIAAFSDLRTAAVERAPFFASRSNLDEAFRLAEAEGHFRVDDVAPVAAAPRIACPVLLIHGDNDKETPSAHSLRILAALHDPKRLITIPGGGHGGGLTPAVWSQLDAWLADQLGARPKPN